MPGAAAGLLGGMIGLGGAKFRLPLLILLFGFAALQAVIVNKALSLVVVFVALPARLGAVPWSTLAPHWTVVVNLLAGSLIGVVPGAVRVPGLAVLLAPSSIKVWRHAGTPDQRSSSAR